MHRTVITAIAVALAAAVTGLGAAPAALAAPVARDSAVPCSASALATAISSAASGATLSLTKKCVYSLTSPLPGISKDLTIAGRSATIQRSHAAGVPGFSIFTVLPGITFVLAHARVSNGSAAIGGGIRNIGGDVTVNNVLLSGNSATGSGGGIYNSGILQVYDCVFRSNSAGSGGGIYSGSFAAITGSTFSGNTARADGGALASYGDAHRAQMTVTASTLTGNQAGRFGGGIATGAAQGVPQGALDVSDSVISLDGAGRDGGGIYGTRTAVTLAAVILTGNSPGSCAPAGSMSGCGG